jgi:hypothetical protein
MLVLMEEIVDLRLRLWHLYSVTQSSETLLLVTLAVVVVEQTCAIELADYVEVNVELLNGYTYLFLHFIIYII